MPEATEAQLKALIILKVGDDDKQTLAQAIEGLWLLHNRWASVPGLRYLYALREAITVIQAQERKLVDTKRDGDRSINLSDRFQHLAEMYTQTTDEIKELTAILLAQENSPVISTLARTSPIQRTTVSADVSALIDRRLRGDAYLSEVGNANII